ncbi:hypothetical protein C8R43DRAFT_1019909 [Mycena crocata]|nr:hypothetical protein C8R43DRAFT_1019909 [Mycena crocata]
MSWMDVASRRYARKIPKSSSRVSPSPFQHLFPSDLLRSRGVRGCFGNFHCERGSLNPKRDSTSFAMSAYGSYTCVVVFSRMSPDSRGGSSTTPSPSDGPRRSCAVENDSPCEGHRPRLPLAPSHERGIGVRWPDMVVAVRLRVAIESVDQFSTCDTWATRVFF